MSKNVRGVDHVGVTVTDLEPAHRFIVDGLGGELMYEMLSADQPPLEGEVLERAIGLPKGAKLTLVRMYSLGAGPGIELFRYETNEQQPAARASDIGWQHIGVYVEDLDAAIAQAVAAGGELLAEPWDLIGPEGGPGNRFCMVRAPFGSLVELITYPSPVPNGGPRQGTRWKPAQS
jgi:catechol 2,3-dioxygenase-like lactoylglutathione lyase family enzyme